MNALRSALAFSREGVTRTFRRAAHESIKERTGAVAVVAPQLSKPSHLWMRRQLAAFATDIGTVVTTPGHRPAAPHGMEVVELLAARGRSRPLRMLWRILNGARILAATRRPGVKAVLVHYLTTATKYRRLWRWTGKPVFVHCHGYDISWELRHPHTGDLKHTPGYMDEVRALANRIHFIANSHWTADRLRSIGIPDERVHVKYFGVATASMPPRRTEREEGVRVLYLGRLVDCKGPEQVIRAFELACDQGLQGSLLIAGDGPMRQTCTNLLEASPHRARIHMLGAVTTQEGARLRAEADLFTAHNLKGRSGQEEAFGVTFLEAMAAALPVVATRSGAVPEVVVDGETGILLKPGDVEAHAQALLRLAGDPELRRRLGQNGWERAHSLFTEEAELGRFREIVFGDGSTAR